MPAVSTHSPQRRQDWLYLLVLVLLVVPLRAWLIYDTEVTARDSIGFIRYALSFEKYSWKDVLLANHQHPGYPLSVWAASIPVRALTGPANPVNMQWSAQLASSAAAILLLLPMYYLGKFFFDARVGFWGALFFQCLPVSGHHLSDGISEAVFLLCVCLAFLVLAWAMHRGSAALFAVGGACCGLAYLTRPEGVVVLLATLVVLVGRQFVPVWRRSWKTTCSSTLALTLSSLAVGSLYFGFTGTFTNKPNGTEIFKNLRTQPATRARAEREEGSAPVLLATIFAASFDHRKDPLTQRLGHGLFIVGVEMMQMFQYFGLLAVGLGMLWHLPRLLRVPEFIGPLLFVVFHGMLVLALVCSAGYLSDRHLLAIAIWWSYFGAAGLIDLPGKLGALWPRMAAALTAHSTMVSLVMLVAFLALCMPRTLQKIHGNRVGNHAAGLWLAAHLNHGDVVDDDHAWSHYYAGLVFKEGEASSLPSSCQPTCYVVMTRSQDPEVKIKREQEERKHKARGMMVYHWPESAPSDSARIVVYAKPRTQKEHPWRVAD